MRLVHPIAGMVAKTDGLGMKKKKGKGMIKTRICWWCNWKRVIWFPIWKEKTGNGFLADFAKEKAIELAKNAGKFAVDKGAEFAKEKASEFKKIKLRV